MLGNVHLSNNFHWQVYVNMFLNTRFGLLFLYKFQQLSLGSTNQNTRAFKIKPLTNQGLWIGIDVWMVSFLIYGSAYRMKMICHTDKGRSFQRSGETTWKATSPLVFETCFRDLRNQGENVDSHNDDFKWGPYTLICSELKHHPGVEVAITVIIK